MKNKHLIPANIMDISDKLSDPKVRENERNNYILRLETIREFCDLALKNEKDKKHKEYSKSWKSTRDYCS